MGEGPPLIKASSWLSHIEFEWHSPVWSHWWEKLSANHTVIRFDQRGSGLSENRGKSIACHSFSFFWSFWDCKLIF